MAQNWTETRWVSGSVLDGTQHFFAKAPKFNPNAHLVTGVVCGVRVEDVEHPLMKQIRQLDKLVDELAKGKAMEKILRG